MAHVTDPEGADVPDVAVVTTAEKSAPLQVGTGAPGPSTVTVEPAWPLWGKALDCEGLGNAPELEVSPPPPDAPDDVDDAVVVVVAVVDVVVTADEAPKSRRKAA